MFTLRLCLFYSLLTLPLYSQPLNQPENLFTQYERARAGISNEPLKCGFTALATLQAFSQQSEPRQRILKLAAARPVLPRSYFTADNRFRIHYAIAGDDAVSPVSTNPAGVPDFVYEAGLAAQRAYALLVDTLGMRAHAPDNGVDGSEFDFYIINLGNLYGETRFDFSTGTGPSYIVIDNDYGPGFYSQGLDGLRVTVAHEYFHAVQLNYYLRGEDIFFFEISSVWFEDFAYDDVNDYFAYLRRWFRETSFPLNTKNGSHEYGSALWLHYLVKRLGGAMIVRNLWERIVQESATFAMKSVLQANPYGLPFNQAMQEFYTWCFFTNYRADGEKYFEEGEEYPSVQFELTKTLAQNETVSGELNALAAEYYRFIRTAQDVQGSLQIAADPGRFGLTAMLLDENGEYVSRTGYGLAPVLITAQARQDTVVFVVVQGSLPINSTISNNYQLQLTLGDQIELENALDLPYPNPFRPGVHSRLQIPYRLKQANFVKAVIFSEDGRIVWQYNSKQRSLAGSSSIPCNSDGRDGCYGWDGRDESGQPVPSGVYVLRLFADDFVETAKFVVINR